MPLGTHKATLFGVAGVSTGADVVLLSTTTASGADEVDITSGIDSTYTEYIFKFYNLNPGTDGSIFSFQANAAGASGFNETITSTAFIAYHKEDGSVAALGYSDGDDQGQGTAFQNITALIGSGADENSVGELHLFNPSSTTYVKHFYSTAQVYQFGNFLQQNYTAGYINTTTAIDEISFKMHQGNFDGTIKMWGVKN